MDLVVHCDKNASMCASKDPGAFQCLEFEGPQDKLHPIRQACWAELPAPEAVEGAEVERNSSRV